MSLGVQLSRRITLDGLDPIIATRNLMKFINLGVGEDKNVALGYKSQVKFDKKNLVGYNVGIGYECLYYNSTSQYNVAIGYECLRGGTSADGGTVDANLYTGSHSNVAIGYQCGQFVGSGAEKNVLIGFECAKAATDGKFVGDNNTFIGYQCGIGNTTGSSNVFMGAACGFANLDGEFNVAIGTQCLYLNTNGHFNTVIGYQSIYTNTNKTGNTAIGYKCMSGEGNISDITLSNTNTYNVGIGTESLFETTTGQANVAIGTQCLASNTSGSYNTVMGYQSLYSNTTGNQNVAMGYQSLYSNTTSNNTAIGYKCSYFNSSGQYNTAIGYKCLEGETDVYTGTNANVAIGYQCGLYIGNNAINNVLIGYECASGTSGNEYSGDNNVLIGYQAGKYSKDNKDSVLIGKSAGRGSIEVIIELTSTPNLSKGSLVRQTSSGAKGTLSANSTNGTIKIRDWDCVTGSTTTVFVKSQPITINHVDYTVSSTDIVYNSMSTGDYNVYVGYNSGYYALGGHDNTGIGTDVLKENDLYKYNSALGYQALRNFGKANLYGLKIISVTNAANTDVFLITRVFIKNDAGGEIENGTVSIGSGTIYTANTLIAAIDSISEMTNSAGNSVSVSFTGVQGSVNTVRADFKFHIKQTAGSGTWVFNTKMDGSGTNKTISPSTKANTDEVKVTPLQQPSSGRDTYLTAIGYQALWALSIPYDNANVHRGHTAIGFAALRAFNPVTSPNYGMTALGAYAGVNNVKGKHSVLIGYEANKRKTTTNHLISIGAGSNIKNSSDYLSNEPYSVIIANAGGGGDYSDRYHLIWGNCGGGVLSAAPNWSPARNGSINLGYDAASNAANWPSTPSYSHDNADASSGSNRYWKNGYFTKVVTAESYVPFTGQHNTKLKQFSNDLIGLIVCSTGNYILNSHNIKIYINDSWPETILSYKQNLKSVVGVISINEEYEQQFEKNSIKINSVGEGGIWVSNINGNIENGDYITTSNIPGYGQKQNDDLLHNYTVAKITCDCNFTSNRILKKIKYKETNDTIDVLVFDEVNTTEEKDTFTYSNNKYYFNKNKTIYTKYTPKYEYKETYNNTDEKLEMMYKKYITETQKILIPDLDNNNNLQFENDLDENGNIRNDNLETRFLQADAIQITEMEYNTKLAAGESVYIACFVGCTYHCG